MLFDLLHDGAVMNTAASRGELYFIFTTIVIIITITTMVIILLYHKFYSL